MFLWDNQKKTKKKFERLQLPYTIQPYTIYLSPKKWVKRETKRQPRDTKPVMKSARSTGNMHNAQSCSKTKLMTFGDLGRSGRGVEITGGEAP